ncbi:branched-chain amino acid ABC transporter permease [Subtercola boreus]|uniref:branched-chain amino acid ABC transporter permease n=1 Tax=Subtercola boreus TaxID=120213 RepID=UPI001559FE05|nr:branched-chain amino acid ABC transporter permease [Subtercola boreus]
MFLAAFGPAIGRYQMSLVTTLLAYVAAATAWNIIGGIGGQFSLASSAFIGVGSYVTIMMLRGTGLPLWSCLATAAVGGALFAALTGVVLFRLRGFYFTIGTLAVALAALTWMTTFAFTGATTGISAPLALIPSGAALYQMALVVAGVATAVGIVVFYSPFGLRLMAVRDDEDVADSLGISPFRSKMVAMTLSGAFIGLAGGVFALQKASIEPFSAFSLDWSITIVVMVVVGGIGTVWGPTIGAIVIYYGITVQLQSVPAVSSVISGILMILVIKFLPHGIVGGAHNAFASLTRRRNTPPKPPLTPRENELVHPQTSGLEA